jgi:hypothetical protein
MTSITLNKSSALDLAEAAIKAYKRRLAGFPVVPRERCEEMVAELQTGKVGRLALSEEQVRTHRNTLREQNERLAFEAAVERAQDLREFFRIQDGPVAVVTLDFNEWSFLAKAETIRPQ